MFCLLGKIYKLIDYCVQRFMSVLELVFFLFFLVIFLFTLSQQDVTTRGNFPPSFSFPLLLLSLCKSFSLPQEKRQSINHLNLNAREKTQQTKPPKKQQPRQKHKKCVCKKRLDPTQNVKYQKNLLGAKTKLEESSRETTYDPCGTPRYPTNY